MKSNFSHKSYIAILICLMVLFNSCNNASKKVLPIYNPADFNPELVDKSLHNSNKYHTVSDFELINQNGKTITQNNYKDKIYVTDFFFQAVEPFAQL